MDYITLNNGVRMPQLGFGGIRRLLRQGGGPGLEPAVQGGGDLFAR